MTIVNHDNWDLSEKGIKDRARHNKKVDDAIRKSVKDVIADSSIISEKSGKKIRIPIKGHREYRFIYGHNKDSKSGGVGQGKGKPGDVIWKKKIKDLGGPGNQKGEDFLEVDVELDYLLEIMFQDLGLPYIEEKTKIQKFIPKGWKLHTISKTGIYPRLHKKRTIQETIKRTNMFLREIMLATNCEDFVAKCAYIQGKYDITKAIDIIKNNNVDTSIDVNNLLFIDDEDLRFRKMEQEFVPQSNAVVILMCDNSGSMTQNKKYLCRSLCFWLVNFLRSQYDNIELRFIVHDSEAKLTSEDEFFRAGASGGTVTHSAFDLADHLLDTEYPREDYNVYLYYVSDGEAWDQEESIMSMERIIDTKQPNMFIYTEINPTATTYYGDALLMDEIIDHFDLVEDKNNSGFYKHEGNRIYTGVINDKDQIWPFLKFILSI